MSSPGMPPIDVVSIRAVSYAEDRNSLLLALRSKYAGERTYSVPIDCMKALIADLQRLGSAPSEPAKGRIEAGADGLPAPQKTPAKGSNGQTSGAKPAQTPNQVTARTPRRWMLGTGLPQHPVVLLVFDPQTQDQAAYVIAEDGARSMSTALLQQAERLAQHRTGSAPTAAPAAPKN
jgi:hypothetical protein